jgi:serine protease AprX
VAVSVRVLNRAVPTALCLAALLPAGAGAAQPKADTDRDGDKLADNLEQAIGPLPDGHRVRLIVSLERDATSSRVRKLERAVGDMSVKRRFRLVDAVALTATKRQVLALARQGVVERVEQDARVRARARAANHSAQASSGVLEARLDAPLLDGNADGDPLTYSRDDLVAAVLDSGIDASHVDLDDGKVLGFKDFVNDQSTPYDDNGHGTHVAGIVAGDGEGQLLNRGVAPGAALVGIKVLDSTGEGFTSDVVAGIQWAVSNKDLYGIEAVNLSLGAEGCGDGFGADSQAVNAAHDAGLVMTVAAGNEGPGTCTIGSPGDAKDALTVGAMADLEAQGFKQADFSSRGPTADGRIKPDISAPGVGVTSSDAGTTNGYDTQSGTSMAAPFVAGVALLMMDGNPAATNDDVKLSMKSTAIDWARGGNNAVAGSSGPDIDYGAGRLDAYAALEDAGVALTSPPTSPNHALREGSLPGTGAGVSYAVDVVDPTTPIAATLIHPGVSGETSSNPDFDLELVAPNGSVVATAGSSERQDELGYQPSTIGVYRLRVRSFSGSGEFFVDVSGGAVSQNGTSEPPPSPPPGDGGGGGSGSGEAPPASPAAPPGESVTAAALSDAARITAGRAVTVLRRAGLRRLLRRRSFILLGRSASAGRVEIAVRLVSGRRSFLVARVTRSVGAAGDPRLVVRLTRLGRRLLRGRRVARLFVRAAVTDSNGRRRHADRRIRVRR